MVFPRKVSGVLFLEIYFNFGPLISWLAVSEIFTFKPRSNLINLCHISPLRARTFSATYFRARPFPCSNFSRNEPNISIFGRRRNKFHCSSHTSERLLRNSIGSILLNCSPEHFIGTSGMLCLDTSRGSHLVTHHLCAWISNGIKKHINFLGGTGSLFDLLSSPIFISRSLLVQLLMYRLQQQSTLFLRLVFIGSNVNLSSFFSPSFGPSRR